MRREWEPADGPRFLEQSSDRIKVLEEEKTSLIKALRTLIASPKLSMDEYPEIVELLTKVCRRRCRSPTHVGGVS